MDQTNLEQKLRSEINRVSWLPLAPHHARGALWLLTDDSDLVEVALAVANDDTSLVAGWIQSGRLRRAESDEVTAWTADPVAQYFEFLIVQPFVFAIEYTGPESDISQS